GIADLIERERLQILVRRDRTLEFLDGGSGWTGVADHRLLYVFDALSERLTGSDLEGFVRDITGGVLLLHPGASEGPPIAGRHVDAQIQTACFRKHEGEPVHPGRAQVLDELILMAPDPVDGGDLKAAQTRGPVF